MLALYEQRTEAEPIEAKSFGRPDSLGCPGRQKTKEVKEEEELPVKVNKNVRNIFVEDDLKSFQENFYLVEPGKNPFYLVNQ